MLFSRGNSFKGPRDGGYRPSEVHRGGGGVHSGNHRIMVAGPSRLAQAADQKVMSWQCCFTAILKHVDCALTVSE